MAYITDQLSDPYIVYAGYTIERQLGTENAPYPGINLMVYKTGESIAIDRITFNKNGEIELSKNSILPDFIVSEIYRLVNEGMIDIAEFQTNNL